MSDFEVVRPKDIAHELSIYGPTGQSKLRADQRTVEFISKVPRLGRFVGEREDSLPRRAKVGPGTHVGLDGEHKELVKVKPWKVKSPWAREPRLKTRVLPEHAIGPLAVDDLDRASRSTSLGPVFGYGYRAGQAASDAESEALRAAQAFAKAPPGPGAHELAESHAATQDTQMVRSKGVSGIVSTHARFLAGPEDIERMLSPAPGLYGEPRGPKGVNGGVPRNPEWEWRREDAEGRLSPIFTATPRDPSNPFRPVAGAPGRNFKRLCTPERARVKAPGPLLVQPKKVAPDPISGPGMNWTCQLQNVAQYHDTPDHISRKGNGAFLSPMRTSQRQVILEKQKKRHDAKVKKNHKSRPKGKGLLPPVLLHGPNTAMRALPETHFSIVKAKSEWRKGGQGRSGYQRNALAPLDREGAVVTGPQRAQCESPDISRRRYNAAKRYDEEQHQAMVALLGFDPAHEYDRAMASIGAESQMLGECYAAREIPCLFCSCDRDMVSVPCTADAKFT